MIFNPRTSGTKFGTPNMGLVLPSPGKGSDIKRERPNNNRTTKFINRAEKLKKKAVKGVDFVTNAPNVLRKQADDLTDKLISLGNELKNEASGVAEENLKQGKIEALGSEAARWLQKNWMLALAGAAVLFFLFRSGK